MNRLQTILATIALATLYHSCTLNASTRADQDTTSAEPTDTLHADTLKPHKPLISFAFTGDVMMGTNFPHPTQYLTKDGGRSLFDDCKDVLREADVTIMNLEGTCYSGTEGEVRKMTNPNTYYIFRMPGDHVENLVDAGVDVVNCANNHSFDFGQTGRDKTLSNLRQAGIQPTGIKDLAEGCILERDGIRIGYVSFAASCTKVLDMLDQAMVEEKVTAYRQKSDILVVGFHGGAEGATASHVPMKEEYYVGEDRGNVYQFAHRCIDLGADLVIGHGPHVPRAMELYKGHLIAYSLGNFCGPYRLGFAGAAGHNPLLRAEVNTADGTFARGRIYSLHQIRGIGPRNDKSQAALHDIETLTRQDFPDTPLCFSADGEVTIKQQ